MTCIMKEDIQKAKKALSQQGYTLGQLHKAFKTSEERVKFLTAQFGNEDEAVYFNNKYERYLLNKQKDSLKEWVRKAGKRGIDTTTTKTLMDKIDSLSKVLSNDSASKPFLNGLVKQKLGFGITQAEANQLKSMNDNVIQAKRALLKKRPDYMTLNAEQFAEALADPETFELIRDLAVNMAIMKEVYDNAKIASNQKERTDKAVIKWNWKGKEVSLGEFLTSVAGNIKSLKATMDISWGRQLSGMFLSGTKEVVQAGKRGWKAGWDAWKDFATTSNEDERRAKALLLEGMIMVRPNALNGNYAKLGVAVGMREEAFPESIATKAKIPGVQNLFVASEKGFNIAIQTARAEIADMLIDMAQGDIGQLKSEGAGDFINQITGRGKLPFNNPNAERAVNAMLFSPRWLASRVMTIFDLKYAAQWGLNSLSGKDTGMIAKMRAKASLAQLTFMAVLIPALVGIRRAMDDDDVHGDDWWERFISAYELRSSDFGKIVIGDTRFDLSFGISGLLVAAARVVTGKSVSVSGVKRDKKWGEVVGAFVEGKMSPGARLTIDVWRKLSEGEDAKNFMYQPITWRGLAAELMLPISIENISELGMETESRTAQIAGIFADIVGLGANTYGVSEKDQGKSDELKKAEFELAWKLDRNPQSAEPAKTSNIVTKLSGDRQKRAIAEYTKAYNDKATALVKSSAYKEMSAEQQSEALKSVRDKVNKDIKRKYGLK